MAFIKDTERKSIFKKINKSYAFRKIIISIEIAGLIAFIALTFISFYYGKMNSNSPWNWFDKNNKLTFVGITFLFVALLLVILGLISLILTFTIKSPKNVTENVSKLASSALPGQKLSRRTSASSQVKERTRSDNKK